MPFQIPQRPPHTPTHGHHGARLVMLNIGPQHPATHGVLRLKVMLEGETIRDVEPVLGYLHRGVEKLFEDGSYMQAIPMTDRLDYIAAMHNNYALVHGVERLMNAQIPERAQYIRAMTTEVQRIASHLLWLGAFGLDLGAITCFWWAMRDREGAISLLERLSGARLTYNWFRVGGVKNDLPPGWTDECLRYIRYMRERMVEWEDLLTDNDIVKLRTVGVAYLDPEVAKNYGCSGPMLRGSGVDWDLRRDEPFNPVYQRITWKPVVQKEGDTYARFRCRFLEIYQSMDMLEQMIAQCPEKGEYISAEIGEGPRQHRLKPPAGEVYAAIEGARGEYGVHIVSDGTNRPYRLKWRAPTLSNLMPLNEMCRGLKIPDLIVGLGSIDIVLGDLDR